MQKPDSLIFDLDGTLWDASETYAESWNQALNHFNISKIVMPQQVAALAGMEAKKVVEKLLPEFDQNFRDQFFEVMMGLRLKLIAKQGGILYPGVKVGLQRLAKRYPLFIVSNCGSGVIPAFMEWAGIDAFITDHLCNGYTHMPKHHNIKLIIDQHFLRRAVYIGDTTGDAEQTRITGIPFIWAAYGFGQVTDYDLSFKGFDYLTEYFMGLAADS